MKSEIIELLNENASIVEKELKQYLSYGNDNGMAKIMEYSLLSGGKRIRPFLTIEAFKLFSPTHPSYSVGNSSRAVLFLFSVSVLNWFKISSQLGRILLFLFYEL